MAIPHDHSVELDRIWAQFLTAPNLLAILTELFVVPANVAETLLVIATKHNIVDALGEALDMIGELLAFPRSGLEDEAYRSALIIRARTLVSGGTIPDFTDLFRAILPDYPTSIPVIEWFPAAVRIYLAGITPEQGKLMELLLKGNLPAAGVNTVINVHDGDCITFSSSHGPVTLLGWFSSSHGPATDEAGWAHAIKI
jgi:hypothetical protein